MLKQRNKNKRGEVEQHKKCRFVAKLVPTSAWPTPRSERHAHGVRSYTSSLRMFQVTAAMEDRELRHLGVEQAFVQATVNGEIHIELTEGYQDFLVAGRTSPLATYNWGQVSRCFNPKLSSDLKTQGYEQSKVGPSVFRKPVEGEM